VAAEGRRRVRRDGSSAREEPERRQDAAILTVVAVRADILRLGRSPPCRTGCLLLHRESSDADLEYAGICLHARYFDPKLGSFLSPDPIGVAGGMNLYAYGLGDPIIGADRSGLMKCHKRAFDWFCLLDPVENDPLDWGRDKMNAPDTPANTTDPAAPGGTQPPGPGRRRPRDGHDHDPGACDPATDPGCKQTACDPATDADCKTPGQNPPADPPEDPRGPRPTKVPSFTVEGALFDGFGGKGLLTFGPEGLGFCFQFGLGVGGGGSFSSKNRVPKTGLIVSGAAGSTNSLTGGLGMETYASRDVLGNGQLQTSVSLQTQRPFGEQMNLDLVTGEFGPSATFNGKVTLHGAAGVCIGN
jgi:RHS repeat-associated protein